MREDHFVRGTDGEGALIVHCQHVMTQLKTLHTKTHHLLAAVHLGDSKWGADSLLFDERLALAEMARLVPHAPPCTPMPLVHSTRMDGCTLRASHPASPFYCLKTHHFTVKLYVEL